MALTIGVAVVLGLFGLVGLFRGVRRGAMALAGTLLAAVLVDLWQERWAAWLRETMRPEQPALPTFLLVASIFVSVAVVIGYGGSVMLPRVAPGAKQPGVLDGPVGGLVGALNGALLVGYLLRYAAEIWPEGWLATQAAGSPFRRALTEGLPWFILVIVVAAGVWVVLRGTMLISRALSARPAAAGSGQSAGSTAAKPESKPASAGGESVAGSRSLKEADRKISGKIDQALGNDRR